MTKPVLLGVAALLILATVIALAWMRWKPDAEPLLPKQRLRAWWTMVAVFALVTIAGPTVSIVGFAFLSFIALKEFLLHLPRQLRQRTRVLCYLAILVQYWWVYSDWYGMFVIFIPVFLFLYLPASGSFGDRPNGHLADLSSLHWGLMTTVFCLSHAAYLMTFPGGPALLFFVTVLTEVSDSVRILVSRTPLGRQVAPLLATLASLLCALILAPQITPISITHAALAGLVLGVAGALGHANITAISRELEVSPGGALARIESLAYTAPLFFHGFRYFYIA